MGTGAARAFVTSDAVAKYQLKPGSNQGEQICPHGALFYDVGSCEQLAEQTARISTFFFYHKTIAKKNFLFLWMACVPDKDHTQPSSTNNLGCLNFSVSFNAAVGNSSTSG